MVKKSNFLIAGAALIVAGSITTYLYFRSVTAKVSSPLKTAQVVPESAIMATFFHPNQKAITKLQQFGTPEAKELISRSYAEFQQENLAETNIDWEKDIKPWVGGIMLAFVPAEEGQGTDPVNILMVVGIKNKFQALRFATKLQGEDESQVIKREYQGVTIREVTDETGKTFNLAILGDYLAIAPMAGAVEAAIDTFRGESSLAMRENTAKSLQESAGVENAIATVFIPNYGQFVREFADELPENQKLSAASLEQFEAIDSMVMGIGVDDGGVRLRALTKFVSPLSPEQTKPVSGKILQRFPAETMMLMSGMGISQAWAEFTSQAENNEDLQDVVEEVRSLFVDFGLDVDREVFGWMDGEFALGLIASNQGVLATTGFGGAMVFETSDRSTAEKLIEKLNLMATENAGLALREIQVGRQSVTQWQVAGIGAFLGYGWLDDNSLFVVLGEPLMEGIVNMSGDRLIGSEGFEQITGTLPESNQGYFYLDMERTMVWVNRYPFANVVIPSDLKAILNSIRGIGVTSSWSDDLTNEMEMLVAF
ncbi:MAG: DUF3352 domain-containing protein [Okeania sp. SIO3I5]|uniref:DUF3352 domain-containing protein n=1 Tax=Okeania sp. SIO3I5 TaxID=2607805 RepID=UPI0013BDF0F8|nr:DUF3352 domain-containing protein [Okeania sp. SIO3I5]NEQ35930.1 DUF3352 domain-containing protein [Okeania sp. SIO3I5]